MNFDIKKYCESGLNELGMTETQVKKYRAKMLATGVGFEGVPVDPAKMVRLRVNYNPITDYYTTELQQEIVWDKDEDGYALMSDRYEEPDPDTLEPSYHPSEDEEEEADKKRKRTKTKKMKKKKNKKIRAPNLEEPKDNPSSPTTTRRSESIETLADKNLDRVIDSSASTASANPPWKLPPKASEDDEADKKKKRKRKMVMKLMKLLKMTKKMKKIQAAPNLEEPKDNPSSSTTTRRILASESIETLVERNLDPVIDSSASTATGTEIPEVGGRSVPKNEDLRESTFIENLDQSSISPVIN